MIKCNYERKVHGMNRLRDMREDHDLEQKDLAKILGISRQYYSRYELGQVELPIRHYITLARYYNVSIDYLCGAVDTPRPLLSAADAASVLPEKQLRLLRQYRAHPQMQAAVDKLLSLD